MSFFEKVIESKKGGTKDRYQETFNRINELNKTDLYFEDINKSWLEKFVKQLEARGNSDQYNCNKSEKYQACLQFCY